MGIKSAKGRIIMSLFHSNCLICNSTLLKDLEKYKKDHLVKCAVCDFVFSKKIPTTQELTTYYDGYSRGGSISEITIKRYNSILDKFEAERKTNNLLDIGCGDAYFLEVAKQRGWTTYGTEYTDEAIEVCLKKGVIMHQGPLDSNNYPGIEFDVITSFEVIEHINNPTEEVTHIKNLLRMNGVAYITTPNFNSFSRYMLGPKWNVIEYPEHLSYYSKSTLTALFRKFKFSRIKSEVSGISINRFRKGISNENSCGAGVNKDEAFRSKSEGYNMYAFIKWALNKILNITCLGDNLKLTFRKN